MQNTSAAYRDPPCALFDASNLTAPRTTVPPFCSIPQPISSSLRIPCENLQRCFGVYGTRSLTLPVHPHTAQRGNVVTAHDFVATPHVAHLRFAKDEYVQQINSYLKQLGV